MDPAAVTAVLFGAAFTFGVALVLASGRLARPALGRRHRLRSRQVVAGSLARSFEPVVVAQAATAVAGMVAGWMTTGLVGLAALLGGLGVLLPPFVAAPARRRRQTAEALAWALWCRQIASLAQAGSGLADSITGSLDHAPEPVAAAVSQVAAQARTDGLEAALDRLGASGAVWEPEVAAGLKMAASSGGGIVGPLLDLSGRIDDVVAMHRASTEAVVQLWVQTIALLVLSGAVVGLMYRNNPAYFDPYSTPAGQMVLMLISAVLLVSVSFLVYHSVVRDPHSVLVPPRRSGRVRPPL